LRVLRIKPAPKENLVWLVCPARFCADYIARVATCSIGRRGLTILPSSFSIAARASKQRIERVSKTASVQTVSGVDSVTYCISLGSNGVTLFSPNIPGGYQIGFLSLPLRHAR